MEEYRQKQAPVLEIVVVIIIVIVVGAVLFPVFAPPRNGTPKSSCQNNLKEIGIALNLYWNDYDGHLPSSALVNGSKRWNVPDYVTFATKRGVLPLDESRNPRTWPELLYDHMKYNDVLFCDKDTADQDNPNSRVSYWYKAAIDKAWYGEGCVKPCTNEKDFAYNADQIVFYEHMGWHFGSKDGLQNGVQINVVYLDSHVKTVTLRNATTGNAMDCAANSSGSPMYFNHDSKTSSTLPDTKPADYIDPGRYSDRL